MRYTNKPTYIHVTNYFLVIYNYLPVYKIVPHMMKTKLGSKLYE